MVLNRLLVSIFLKIAGKRNEDTEYVFFSIMENRANAAFAIFIRLFPFFRMKIKRVVFAAASQFETQ